VLRIKQVINHVALGLEFEHSIVLGPEITNHFAAEAGQPVQGHAVRELPGPDPEEHPWIFLQDLVEFTEQVLDIDKETQPRIVEICLQDTVDTIHGTIHTDVQDMIAAAPVFPGAGTGFEKPALVPTQQKMFLAGGEIGRIDPLDRWNTIIANLDNRQTAAFDYLLGIGKIKTLFLDVEMLYVS